MRRGREGRRDGRRTHLVNGLMEAQLMKPGA